MLYIKIIIVLFCVHLLLGRLAVGVLLGEFDLSLSLPMIPALIVIIPIINGAWTLLL